MTKSQKPVINLFLTDGFNHVLAGWLKPLCQKPANPVKMAGRMAAKSGGKLPLKLPLKLISGAKYWVTDKYTKAEAVLSPTSDVSRPLIGQLTRVCDLVCRGKSCMSG